jgi:proteasome lid subunit RPN8/RPN11
MISLRKKFEITSHTPPYEPAQMRKPSFKVIQDYDSSIEYAHSKSHKLFIEIEAMKQIFEHIGWGKRIERNVVEQGGILLGQVFRDENQKLTYGIAEKAIAGSLAKGSSAYLDMTHETWKQMLDSVDEILNGNPEKNFQVIGWYHTHPNSLSVFMSGTDQSTQSRLFSHAWQFAIVLNPHKQIWKAFYGKNAEECRGFVIDGIHDLESNYFPEAMPGEDNALPVVAPLDRDSNQYLKKIFSTLWRLVKVPFGGKQKYKAPPANQKPTLPKENSRPLKALVYEMKINFFLWFFSFILLLLLSLQIVNFYLQFFPGGK